MHPFLAELVRPVKKVKGIWIPFDLNHYSIPPEATGRRGLTLVASATTVRILDGQKEIVSHRRSYDRDQYVDEAGHEEKLLETKRKARGQTPSGRLTAAVPETQAFLQAAFAKGENAGSTTLKLLRLLDDYGAQALRARHDRGPRARNTPHLFRRLPAGASPPCDRTRPLSPSTSLAVPTWPTSWSGPIKRRSTMSFPVQTTTMMTPDLKEQLAQIGLLALAECSEDFLARASKGSLLAPPGRRGDRPPGDDRGRQAQPGEPPRALPNRPLQAHRRLRLELAQEDRKRRRSSAPSPSTSSRSTAISCCWAPTASARP